jgi:tetratricopeptide (TPR) repeat protein
VAIDDSFATGHHWLGLYLASSERFDEARQELVRARELDPLSPIFATAVGFPDFFERRLEEAVRLYDEIIELYPAFMPVYYYRGLALEQAGHLDEAIASYDRANDLAAVRLESYPASIHALARRGDSDEARRRLELLRIDADTRFVPPLFFAVAHLGLGDYGEAYAALERAIEQRGVRLSELHLDRRFEALPDRERFVALLRRIRP